MKTQTVKHAASRNSNPASGNKKAGSGKAGSAKENQDSGFKVSDEYIASLAKELDDSLAAAYNAEAGLDMRLWESLESLCKTNGLAGALKDYGVKHDEYVAKANRMAERGVVISEDFPAVPAKLKAVAVEFKRAAKAAADSLGYQPQWVNKCLMRVCEGLFRERAKRTVNEVKHPSFAPAQIAYLKEIALKVHLTSRQLEEMLILLS